MGLLEHFDLQVVLLNLFIKIFIVLIPTAEPTKETSGRKLRKGKILCVTLLYYCHYLHLLVIFVLIEDSLFFYCLYSLIFQSSLYRRLTDLSKALEYRFIFFSFSRIYTRFIVDMEEGNGKIYRTKS